MTLDFDDEVRSKASSATDDATLLNQTTTGEAVAKPAVNAPQQQATFCTNLGYKAGCTLTSYYHFAGQRVAMRVQSDANATGTVTWLHGDHLGSASVATNAGGNKIAGSDSRYLPFGEVRSGFAGSGLPTDRRFTGQISIAGGLIDMNARALDPVLGRFISADAIVPNPADPQSLNRFAYGMNNPLRYRDPSGHDAEDAIAFLMGVAYGWVKANREAIPIPTSDSERQMMENAESLAVTHPTFTEGRIAGGAIAVVQGVIEAGSGGTAAGGGVVACATGVGCVAGAPAVAVGVVEIYHGAATALSGAGDAASQLALYAKRGGPGKWERSSESMSDRARDYQVRITGKRNQVYRVNGVKFDGFNGSELIDAKGPGYANFIKNGEFVNWWEGRQDLLNQAQRQIQAANGTPIKWYVAEDEAVDAIRSLLYDNGYGNIDVVYAP